MFVMTEKPPINLTDNAPSAPPRPPARQRPSLYRTVLSLGIAAIAATWLPFSFLYINALSKHATTVTPTPAVHSSVAVAGPGAATLSAVTTRTS
jgi:hypothetical protein